MECRSIRREFLFPVLLVQCSWLTRDSGLRMQRSPRYARGLYDCSRVVFAANRRAHDGAGRSRLSGLLATHRVRVYSPHACEKNVSAHSLTEGTVCSYYLGIQPELLTRLYGGTFATAETFFASLAFGLFPAGPPPAEPFATPQYKILSAIAGRPPKPTRVEHHLELCRLLLGPSLADQLALPRGSLRDVLSVDLEIWTGWALLTFGAVYSRVPGLGRWRGRRWEAERRRWFQWVIELVVIWQLGERRSLFVWRDGEKHALKLDVAEGEEPVRHSPRYFLLRHRGLPPCRGLLTSFLSRFSVHRVSRWVRMSGEPSGRPGATCWSRWVWWWARPHSSASELSPLDCTGSGTRFFRDALDDSPPLQLFLLSL